VDERVDLAIGGLYLHLDQPAGVHGGGGGQAAVEGENSLHERDNPIALNQRCAAAEREGRGVAGPSLPLFCEGDERFISGDCLAMPAR
jgi:hypothetical protein